MCNTLHKAQRSQHTTLCRVNSFFLHFSLGAILSSLVLSQRRQRGLGRNEPKWGGERNGTRQNRAGAWVGSKRMGRDAAGGGSGQWEEMRRKGSGQRAEGTNSCPPLTSQVNAQVLLPSSPSCSLFAPLSCLQRCSSAGGTRAPLLVS
jgi:hypothetical protein